MHKTLLTLTATFALLLTPLLSSAAEPASTPAQKPDPRLAVAASILADIDQATWIAEGKGPGVIYIFFDPNCPYCHKLYENTRDWVKQDKVELRWIPVGVLTATSAGKAAAMLGADDPLKAFYENEDGYKRGAGGGGLDEALSTPEIDQQLQANEALLSRTRSGAVPAMFFRSKDGAPLMVTGAPPKDKMPVILRYLDTAVAK